MSRSAAENCFSHEQPLRVGSSWLAAANLDEPANLLICHGLGVYTGKAPSSSTCRICDWKAAGFLLMKINYNWFHPIHRGEAFGFASFFFFTQPFFLSRNMKLGTDINKHFRK